MDLTPDEYHTVSLAEECANSRGIQKPDWWRTMPIDVKDPGDGTPIWLLILVYFGFLIGVPVLIATGVLR